MQVGSEKDAARDVAQGVPVGPTAAGSPEPETGASSVGSEVVAGLLGLCIAIACVLPPVVHLVTGPLGAFIGGFVAANRVSPGVRGRAIIAGMIGTGLAGVVGLVAKVFAHLAGPGELPRWFPSNGTLLIIVGIVWLYGTGVSAVGTTMSGALSRKSAPEADAAGRRDR